MQMKLIIGRFKNLQVFFLFVLLGALLYGHVLHAPFFFDDNKMIVENWTIRNIKYLENIWQMIDYPRLCFLAFATFALNYHFGTYDPFGYHLVNVALHSATTFLFYRLLLILFSLPARVLEPLRERRFSLSLAAALIFLAHPLQTQAVSFIWSRTEILSAFFGFLSLLFYLHGRITSRFWPFCLSLSAFIAGVFSRGNIIILPLLIILVEITFFDLSLEKLKSSSRKIRLFLFAAGLLFLAMLRYAPNLIDLLRLEAVIPDSLYSTKTYFFTQLRVIIRYIQLLFIPLNQNVDHYILPSESFWEIKTVIPFFIIVSLLIGTGLLMRRRRVMAFGIFWFFICLIPVSTIFILSTTISESRLYFPLAGFAVFITMAIDTWIKPLKMRRIILTLFIVGLGGLTILRNNLWRSPITLMEDAVLKSPLHHRPHLVLGSLYAQAGRLQAAARMYQKVIDLKPDYLDPYNNLGVVYMKMGNLDRAREIFSRVIDIDQRYLYSYLNLGYIAISQQDWWLAKESFMKCIKYCGPRSEAYMGLADAYMLRRDGNAELMDSGAMVNLKKVLELDPRNKPAFFKLGQIYFARKEYDNALAMFQEILKLDPDDDEALLLIGQVYVHAHRWAEARQTLLRAIKLNPKNPEGYGELGKLYFALKEFEKAQEYYQKADLSASQNRKD